jgi:hypothetical protein
LSAPALDDSEAVKASFSVGKEIHDHLPESVKLLFRQTALPQIQYLFHDPVEGLMNLA